MTPEEKTIELEKITEEISEFKGLEIAKTAQHPVPGEGNPDAEILCIGEGPGFHEDQQGRPFVGVSGQLLRKTLTEIGIPPESVFITNIVKYRPPDNRDPLPEEIEACKNWLDRQIQIIEPKIIVTLGRFSMGKFIPGASISRIHGQPQRFGKYIIFPMFHPAAALRGTTVMHQFRDDFLKLKNFLNNTPEMVAVAPPPKIADNVKQLDLF